MTLKGAHGVWRDSRTRLRFPFETKPSFNSMANKEQSVERKRPDATVLTVKQEDEEREKDQFVEGVVNGAERSIKLHWRKWVRNQSKTTTTTTFPDSWLYGDFCDGLIWLDFDFGVFAHYNPWHWESEDLESSQ